MKYAKQVKLADELVDELRKRVSSYTFTTGFDSNGWPTIALNDGSAATTEDNVFIRIRPRDWSLQKDVLGLDQTVFVPSVIQLAVEAPSSGLGLARYVTIAHALAVLVTCAKRGTRLEYWEETNGTAPSVTTFDTANKQKTSIEPELDWPLLASQ
jgi:hypothetical protein